ncbi:hypothetical protein POM88_003146 [Heracleum sosnowskyi]|uniref:Uncharacterized protein n=1 Tax=Heracleum sosnowskyi TaxID=360622 RepID=A0AAD8JJ05_9APIA|nr:hypothetical protein POM88_003146 [Heracleum sosnowskyi]
MIHMAFCSSLAFILVIFFNIVEPVTMSKDLYFKSVVPIGEAKFDVFGVVLQLGTVAFEATRLVLIQILLNAKGIKLNPITWLYYVAPCCLVFLSVPWFIVELPGLMETSSFRFDILVYGTNSVCAFALNLAVFLVVGKTWALTMNVAGGHEAQKKAQTDEEAGRLLEERGKDAEGKNELDN